MATVGAVIVGAGRGERMGGVDKVFAPLGDRPILAYSLAAFEASRLVHYIVVVLGDEGRLRPQPRWSRPMVQKCEGSCLLR